MADNTSFIFFFARLVLRVHASVIFIGGYREDNFKIQMITKETCTYVIHTYLGTGYPLFLPNSVRVPTVPRCNHVLKARCHYQSFLCQSFLDETLVVTTVKEIFDSKL